jgi:Na+-driven multidrug efflux pump
MQDLTTGPISTHLLKTASFMLVTMVFQTLYFLVDLYWVGHLGKEAVAGVGVAGNLTFIVLAVSQMLGVGTTTLVSHAAGQRNAKRALLVFNQSQVLSTVVGLAFLTVSMAFRTAYANGLSADATTAGSAADYLLYFLPAMSLQFGMVGMASALRGVGNFKPGMVVQTATIIINIVLAPVLMFGGARAGPWCRGGGIPRSSPWRSASPGRRPTLRPRKHSLRRTRHECSSSLKDMPKIDSRPAPSPR